MDIRLSGTGSIGLGSVQEGAVCSAPFREELSLLAKWEPYFIPRSVRILGFSSSAARTWWHAEQSLVIVWPSALV